MPFGPIFFIGFSNIKEGQQGPNKRKKIKEIHKAKMDKMGCNARQNSEYSGLEKEIPQMMLLTVQLSMNGLHAKDY